MQVSDFEHSSMIEMLHENHAAPGVCELHQHGAPATGPTVVHRAAVKGFLSISLLAVACSVVWRWSTGPVARHHITQITTALTSGMS